MNDTLEKLRKKYLFFIESIRNKTYESNPEIAQQLSGMWSELILSFNGRTSDTIAMCTYLHFQMEIGFEDGSFLIRNLCNYELREQVRACWDEMYVESRFMSSEDRGW